jgi:hypothetical protein
LGGNIGNYIEANHWAVGMDYRYLHADEVFQGSAYQPQFQQGGTNADITVHSWDVFVTYAPIKRLDLTLNIPFSYGEADVVSNRLHQTAGGLGDIRFTADTWVLPPDNNPNGNVSLGVGFKAPSGDSNYKNDGQTYIVAPGVYAVGTRPVDSALQPGDGAWAVIGELSAFQKIFPETYLYLAGSYQFSTVGEGDTETTLDPTVHYSAPDTYLGRAGATYFFWPSQGLSLSLGGRVEGVPVRNVITGSDLGFRRPGYAVYIEPSIAWNFKDNTVALSGPVAVYRVRENSTRDEAGGTNGVGGLANFLIIFSYTHWF